MAIFKKHPVLSIVGAVLLLLIVGASGFAIWLSSNYKSILKKRIPLMLAGSTDSVYHVSFTDIDINIRKHTFTITGLKVWPDMNQVQALRRQHRKAPNTVMTISAPRIEAINVAWGDLPGKKTLNCGNVVVHKLNLLLSSSPFPLDSTYFDDIEKTPFVKLITAGKMELRDPDITYDYKGPHKKFTYHLNGGSAVLNDWVYYHDKLKDTSVFLFAHSGSLRSNTFTLKKSTGVFTAAKPTLDFTSTENSVTLKNIRIRDMKLRDGETGNVKEIHNVKITGIEMKGFNWNRLLIGNQLFVREMNVADPIVDIKHFDKYTDNDRSKVGSYPQQLLLTVRINTDIRLIKVQNADIRYTAVTKKGDEALVAISDIDGSISNVTNIPAHIAKDKNCIVKLKGKFMGKSETAVTFTLSLADKSGRFSLDGYIKNVDGKDVTPQARAFTIAEVTSFQLDRMDMHIEGDETYSKGSFTALYKDLKISLFKFNTDLREGKKGPFAFVGSTILLYPSNPMPGEEVRRVTTSFARDTARGFLNQVWKNMLRAGQKTAVRNKDIVTLVEGKETEKGEQPKKGFFKRLFGRKDR